MITFLIHFKESFDLQRFLVSIFEKETVIKYSVSDSCTLLTISLECKLYFHAVIVAQTVDTILRNLEIDIRPFSFNFSELLN